MALETSELEGGSLLDYVDASLKAMAPDLMPADAAMVGVIRKAAMAYDLADADGKALSAMNYLSYVGNGMEKLGGSLMARKALGIKPPEKPKTGLASVRGLRSAPSAAAQDAAKKPRAPRKAKGA
jgi:hypothetical protein